MNGVWVRVKDWFSGWKGWGGVGEVSTRMECQTGSDGKASTASEAVAPRRGGAHTSGGGRCGTSLATHEATWTVAARLSIWLPKPPLACQMMSSGFVQLARAMKSATRSIVGGGGEEGWILGHCGVGECVGER